MGSRTAALAVVAAVAWTPAPHAATILEPTLPTVEFVMEPVILGLRYKVTESSETTRTQIDSVNIDDGLSLTSTRSVESVVSVRETVAGKLGVGGVLGSTMSLKLEASGSMERSSSYDVTTKESEVRQRIWKADAARRDILNRITTKKVTLEDQAGYVSTGLRIVNRGTETLTVENVEVAIVGVRQGDGATRTLLSDRVRRHDVATGSVPGRSPDAASGADPLSIEVQPVGGGVPYRRAVTFERVSNSQVIEWLEAGETLQARVVAFDLKRDGQTIRPADERAKLLARAAELRIIGPDGYDRAFFVAADGASGVLDALSAAGLSPVAEAADGGERLVGLLGRKSDFTRPASPPALYDRPTMHGTWIVAALGSAPPDLRAPLTAGQRVLVVHMTNLDFARANPPRDSFKLSLRSPCTIEDRPPTRFARIPAPPLGSIVSLEISSWEWFAKAKTVETASLFEPSRQHPFEDANWLRFIKAKSTLLDRAETPFAPRGSLAELGLGLAVGKDMRYADLSRVAGGGASGFSLTADGRVRTSFAVSEDVLGGDKIVLATAVPAIRVAIGRSADPRRPSGRVAHTPGGNVDWPSMWIAEFPLRERTVHPARRHEISAEVVYPVIPRPDGMGIAYPREKVEDVQEEKPRRGGGMFGALGSVNQALDDAFKAIVEGLCGRS